MRLWLAGFRVLWVLAFGGALGAVVALAQNAGTQRLFPPADDPSLVNHQPWACNQLTGQCAYQTIVSTGIDQTTQIQAALNNCGAASGQLGTFTSVRLGPGVFTTSAELLVPPNCVFTAENGLNYTPYSVSTANSVIKPSGSFSGTGVVAFNGNISGNGHFGVMRGLNVDDNYTHLIDFQGYIVGTVLHVVSINSNTLSPGLVAWMDIRDKVASVAAPTKVVNQLSGTTGGVGTYTIIPSQTVGSVGTPIEMAGVIHCFEHIANASFTTVEDLQALRCTGDGYNVTADGSQAGGQGGNGLIRPIMHGGLFALSEGEGVRVTQINSSAATDMIIDRGLNSASNGNNSFLGQTLGDIELDSTEGQLSDTRTEQDGACGIYINGSSSLYLTNFFSDTNRGGAVCIVGGSSVNFANGGTFTRDSGAGKAAITLSGSSSAAFLGFQVSIANVSFPNGWQYTIKTDATSSASGWFVTPPVYFNAQTQTNVSGGILQTAATLPVPPATINLIQQGGTGFTVGWTTTHATNTTGQTDPLAGTNAAKIVEDNTSNTHTTQQSIIVPDNTTYSCAVYYKALGVGSARGFGVSITGAVGSAFIAANSTGTITNSGASGGGVLVSSSSNTTVGSGWIQLIITASTLGGGVGNVTLALNSGGAGTYLGDATSGQFMYGPVCVAGSSVV